MDGLLSGGADLREELLGIRERFLLRVGQGAVTVLREQRAVLVVCGLDGLIRVRRHLELRLAVRR